jgi:paraquat-inducible protein B
VTRYDLDADGSGVTLRVFINAPYDKYVKHDTRFWQASGVDVSLDTSGVKVNTESLVAILVGGLAFESPPDAFDTTEAATNTEFRLFNERAEAMKRQDRIVDKYVFNFKESVRGLAVGAPVEFRGIVVGEVSAIYTRYDPVKKEFSIPVEIRYFPERFTSHLEGGKKEGRVTEERRKFSEWLVERGLRGQLRTGNLLTGQLYIALEFFPNAPKSTMNWEASPPEIPTIPGGLQSLQDSVTELVAKLNKIPFEGIGKDLRQTLQSADTLLKTLDNSVAPEARKTLQAARAALDAADQTFRPNSTMAQSTIETMRELSRTAAAFRTLAEYLERHPEALIYGKPEDKK